MRDLSLHLMDLAQNSLSAGATQVDISLTQNGRMLNLVIADNGRGMDEKTLQNALSPFGTSRKERKVGLGIPLTREHCLACGGQFDIKSQPGKGTGVEASFDTSHIDCPPLGDLALTLLMLITANPQTPEWLISVINMDDSHTLDTRQIKQVLGQVPLNAPDVIPWLDKTLQDMIKALDKGVEA